LTSLGSGQTGETDGVTSTYGDVDRSSDPTKAVEWQEYVDSWPQISAYKRRIIELMQDADRVLDIGCGPGGDVVAIGAGRCVGIDRSFTMCASAASRGARTIQADAGNLPFASGVAHGAIADRVIQHVEDPAAVVNEIARTLRRGGRLVVADPDQESLSIHVPGARRETTAKVKELRRDVGYRNGTFVSSLPAVLAAMGFADVSVDPYPLLLRDPADAFGLRSWPRHWRCVGGFTDQDILDWEECVDASRSGGFIFSLTYLVVSGVRG
jgi:SAM-dependent methyltransferase